MIKLKKGGLDGIDAVLCTPANVTSWTLVPIVGLLAHW